jgi:diguanylate cyclase (GGDEF)-like protein
MMVWGRAFLTIIIGWGLIGLRGLISPFFSIVIASVLLHFGVAELYQSLRLFDGQSPYRRYTNLLVLATTLLIIIFFYLAENLIIRMIISSLVLMALFGLAAWKIIHCPSGSPSTMRRLVGLGFGLMLVIYLIRIIFILRFPESFPVILTNTPLQTFVFGGSSLGFSIITFGYLLMCSNHFNNQLKRLAATDPLTGLYNRRAFTDQAVREINRAGRSGEMPAIFLIDVDDFKAINDRFGHGAGDEALCTISNHLRQALRSHDIIGRFGGDEFVALLPGTDHQEAVKIAERLSETIRKTPFLIEGTTTFLSVSVGLAVAEKERLDFNDLFHKADQSLYEAKRRQSL